MGRRLLYSFLAVALAVGIAVGLSLLSPLRRPPAQTVDLVRSTRLTCLPAGRALVLGDSTISLTPLGGEVGPGASGPIDTVIAGPTVLTSNSLIVGGVLTGSTPPGYVPCTAPMPTGILTVTDPASSELLLVNTDANEAVVDLTLLGSDGEIDAVGARGIAIAPGASRTIALSVLVPDAPVGVEYATSQGRVVVLAQPLPGRAVANIGAAAPASEHLIAGIPAGAESARIILTNPGTERLDVAVSALGATSSYEPAPAAGLSLEPRSSVVVDLGSSLGGEASALRLTAAEPFGVGVETSAAGVRRMLLPAAAGRSLGVSADEVGSVLVSNPGIAAVSATVTVAGTSQQVQIPVGTTLSVAAAGTGPVLVEADAPVVAAALSSTGSVGYPLSPTRAEESEGQTIVADPTLR